jgi:hypothetical protein
MKPSRWRVCAELAAAALVAGCAGSADRLSTLAAEPRLLVGHLPEATTVSRAVEVRDVSHVIFWVPTDGQPPTVEDAVAEALNRGHGDVLVNVTVERVAWYVPILYGEYGWIVRGDVVRLRDRRAERIDLEAEPAPDAAVPAPEPHERPASAPPES